MGLLKHILYHMYWKYLKVMAHNQHLDTYPWEKLLTYSFRLIEYVNRLIEYSFLCGVSSTEKSNYQTYDTAWCTVSADCSVILTLSQ